MENEAHQNYLGLETEQSGVRVTKLDPLSPSSEYLKTGDVILSVDGTNVSLNAGTILFSPPPPPMHPYVWCLNVYIPFPILARPL